MKLRTDSLRLNDDVASIIESQRSVDEPHAARFALVHRPIIP
jgi:hypothetical protein